MDHGAPVSIFTVSRELGHGSEALVKKIYGHLGTVRHRANVVEYRVEQHRKVLKSSPPCTAGQGSIKFWHCLWHCLEAGCSTAPEVVAAQSRARSSGG